MELLPLAEMKKWLDHQPNGGFTEAAFAINSALAIYAPTRDFLTKWMCGRYRRIVDELKVEEKLRGSPHLDAVNTAVRNFESEIARLGVRAEFHCKIWSVVLAVFCLTFLFLDKTGVWIVFFALMPVYFCSAFWFFAARRYKKFNRDVRGFLTLAAPDKPTDDEIDSSLGPLPPRA